MRKVVMMNRISVDGYFASLNETTGGMDWFVPDPAVDKALHALPGLDAADTLLLGSVTYMLFESSWLPVLHDPHAPADKKATAQELAGLKKIVFAEKIHSTEWPNTEFHESGVVEAVKELKDQTGGTILIMGSGSIVRQLTTARLIDEYVFVVTPVIAGQGKTLFQDVGQVDLRLADVQRFDSGNVMLRYERVAQK